MAAATMSTPPPPDPRWPRPGASDDDDSDDYGDDDEVNTSNARVFFGKLRTPEKRFAHLHTPKAHRPLNDVGNGPVHTTPSAQCLQPVAQDTSPNLISFDNSPLATLPADSGLSANSQPVQVDLLDATVVLDEPPVVAQSTLAEPTRVPLPDSPLDAMSVETLLTPSKLQKPSPNQPAAHVDDAPREAPELEQAAAEPATPTRTDALPILSTHEDVPPAAPVEELEDAALPVAPADEPMMTSPPTTPQRPSPSPVDATPKPPVEPVLNISLTLSPTTLHTPKRKHGDAFPNAAAPPGEVRKKAFAGPRLRPADPTQPKASTSAPVKAAPRPPMLGSLSPETDGVLARLLAPSNSGGRAELNLNINIDFSHKLSPLPSLGTSGASLQANDAPPSRPGSPKRVPVSVIFRSPSPARRVLVSSPARVPSPSPPPKHAEILVAKPTGLMATRKLPFPLQKAASHLPAPQSSPSKPAPQLQIQSSPIKPSGSQVSTTSTMGTSRPKPSQLRQPTVRTVSRIPQPKPYAAPPSKAKPAASTSALPTRAAKGFSVSATKVMPSPPHPAQPPSPVKPIMIRQVIPGMLGGNRDKAPPVARISKPSLAATHFGSPQRPLLNFGNGHVPVTKQEPIKIRQVIPGTLRHYEGRPTTPPPAPPPPPAPLLPPIATLPPSSPTPPPREQRPRTPPSEIALPTVPALPAATAEQPHSEPSTRRTARARTTKPVAQHRLELPAQGPQLKALTNANTLKNQAWTTTTLETVIVRRPGARPASPSTRMRSAAEKKREEAGREREMRAKRRAGEPVDDAPMRRRHALGPGEESDYETPESVRVLEPGRAVRWDPGLVSTPLRRGEDESFRPKSILTPAPSKPRVPLHEVRREKVVISKFVYDDDDEAILESVASSSEPEPVVPAAPVKPKPRKRKAAETA